MTAREWIEAYSEALGVAPPSEAEVDVLLRLAGAAAHGSERPAAPIACWLAARAGRDPSEALVLAEGVAGGT